MVKVVFVAALAAASTSGRWTTTTMMMMITKYLPPRPVAALSCGLLLVEASAAANAGWRRLGEVRLHCVSQTRDRGERNGDHDEDDDLNGGHLFFANQRRPRRRLLLRPPLEPRVTALFLLGSILSLRHRHQAPSCRLLLFSQASSSSGHRLGSSLSPRHLIFVGSVKMARRHWAG